MGKSYMFTAQAQIDRLLQRSPERWFTVREVARSGEVGAFSYSNVAASLVRSCNQAYQALVRQCIKGTFYYRYQSDDRFTKACDCYLACVVDGKGYIGGEDDCPIHGLEY